MDESNQYDQAIKKPVDNKMGHLFVVNIKFDKNKAREREFLFNEVYLPIFRKKWSVRSKWKKVFQLVKTMRINGECLQIQ